MTSFPLDADGIWVELRRADPAGRPALFLDRDGLLVEDPGYLHRPQDLRLLPGAGGLLAAASAAGWATVLVTNQSGIARGYYDWAAFAATQDALHAALKAEGAALDLVLACPFHGEGQGPYRIADHPCRKPNPGMLLKAQKSLRLELAKSWIAGDRASDLAAGRAAGLALGLLVASARDASEREKAKALAMPSFDVELADDLHAALKLFRRR